MSDFTISPLHKLIVQRLIDLDINQRELATRVGKRPNVISMIIRGEMMLPIELAEPLSQALQLEGPEMYEAAFASYPNAKTWATLQSALNAYSGSKNSKGPAA